MPRAFGPAAVLLSVVCILAEGIGVPAGVLRVTPPLVSRTVVEFPGPLFTPTPAGTTGGPGAIYKIQCNADTDVTLNTLAFTPDGSADSCFVSMGGGKRFWDLSRPGRKSYALASNPPTFSVKKGEVTLEVYGREDGVRFLSFLLVSGYPTCFFKASGGSTVQADAGVVQDPFRRVPLIEVPGEVDNATRCTLGDVSCSGEAEFGVRCSKDGSATFKATVLALSSTKQDAPLAVSFDGSPWAVWETGRYPDWNDSLPSPTFAVRGGATHTLLLATLATGLSVRNLTVDNPDCEFIERGPTPAPTTPPPTQPLLSEPAPDSPSTGIHPSLTKGAGVGAALAAITGSSSLQEMNRVALLGMACPWDGSEGLPLSLHPTQQSLGSGKHAVYKGCLVYNVAIVVAAAALQGAFVWFRWLNNLVRFPTFPLVVHSLLLHGTMLSSFHLLYHADTAWRIAGGLGAAAGLASIAVLHVFLGRLVWRMRARFHKDPFPLRGSWFVGRGDWVNKQGHPVESFGVLFRPYFPNFARFGLWDMGHSCLLALVAAVDSSTPSGCAAQRLIYAFLTVLFVVMLLVCRPFTRPCDLPFDVLANILSAASQLFLSLSLLSSDKASWGYTVAEGLGLASLGAMQLRLAFNIIATIAIAATKRQERLQKISEATDALLAEMSHDATTKTDVSGATRSVGRGTPLAPTLSDTTATLTPLTRSVAPTPPHSKGRGSILV